jgi:hypothetical protein
MMRFVQSYARAHAHAYPHTPTRTRTHTGSSLSKGPASLRPCPAGSALWRLRCPTTRSPSRMSRPARLKWAAAEVRARDARACKADRAFCGGCPCRLCPRRCENVWGCAPFLKALGTHCISRSGPRPPTRIAYSPASPLSPWLPNPRHTHTHGPRQQGCVQCTWHSDWNLSRGRGLRRKSWRRSPRGVVVADASHFLVSIQTPTP